MRIDSVDTVRVRTPLWRPFVTAVRRSDHVESVLVRVHDADGRTGWGEATHNPRVTGETSDGIEAVINAALRDAVVGHDALDLIDTGAAIAAAVHGNASAKAAVDTATHDLAARQLGVPLHVMLGGTRTRVRIDATLSVGDLAELAGEAATHAAAGFAVLKVKLDGHGDAADTVARLQAISDAAENVGDSVRLRVDANQAWSPKQAVRLITAMEDAGLPLELVEQPVAAADLAGLAFVTARVNTPVLADEAVRTAADVVDIARHGAADLVNLKLAKCGGIGPARAFVSTAQACGLGVVVGAMLETHVSCGAAAALASALLPADAVTDLDPPVLLRSSPVLGGIRSEGPTLLLSDRPGSGIDGVVDEQVDEQVDELVDTDVPDATTNSTDPAVRTALPGVDRPVRATL